MLEEKEIGDFTRRKPTPQNPGSIRLKPGDDVYLSTATKSIKNAGAFHLVTTGNYQLEYNRPVLSDFKVFITCNHQKDNSKPSIQNLSDHFGFNHVFALNYYGDIDGDNKPDVILVGSGEATITYYLFLSSLARKNEILRLVSTFSFYDKC